MITNSLMHLIAIGREGQNYGYSMGLPKLENVVDGVSKSTYTLIFSTTGSGKTSLALYAYIYKPLIEHLEDDSFKVIYYSLEMSSLMLFAKLLCIYIFENFGLELSVKELLSKKKNFKLSDEQYEIIKSCLPWLHKIESKIIIYDKSLNAETLYLTLNKELEKEGEFKEEGGRKIFIPKNEKKIILVVIDHLSLVRSNKGRSLKEEMDLISAYLVTMRNRCGISPIVIMQANRDSSSMDRRKEGLNNLTINDTKDSGSPAQDAEIIISIFDPARERLNTYKEYRIKNGFENNFRSITVLKSRYGASNVEIGCAFYGKAGIFAELPKPDLIIDYTKYKNSNWVLENLKNPCEETLVKEVKQENKENKENNIFNFTL